MAGLLSSLLPRSAGAALRMVLFAALGGVAGFCFLPGKHGFSGGDDAPPEVTLVGKPVPLARGRDAALVAAREILRAYLSENISVKIPGAAEGKKIERPREQLGARIDGAHLEALIAATFDPRSALLRAHAQVARGKKLELPVPVAFDERRALTALAAAKEEVDRAPEDAKFDLEKRKVIPDRAGVRLDVYGTLVRLADGFASGEPSIEASVAEIVPGRSIKEIGDVRIDDVLGYFETKYARDQKHEARTYNLRLAAQKLDGYILLPGETFDFNTVVGPRSEANGYKVAPVIAQGELVDGIGGGTCQISGTLHGASFFSGLDIPERKPHTRPSFYIKMGMDAAVSYPAITLKIKNPFAFPVVLHETVQNGVVRAEILGPKRTRDVTFVRKIDEAIPFAEKEVPEPKIPRGKRVLAQRGIPGFKVIRFRIVRDGANAYRERIPDFYPPTMQIWKVGTGPSDPKWDARDDEHPEYIADEVLTVSQGPSIKDPKVSEPPKGGNTIESRVAGRYGSHGWIVKEGFAKSIGAGANKDSDDKPD